MMCLGLARISFSPSPPEPPPVPPPAAALASLFEGEEDREGRFFLRGDPAGVEVAEDVLQTFLWPAFQSAAWHSLVQYLEIQREREMSGQKTVSFGERIGVTDLCHSASDVLGRYRTIVPHCFATRAPQSRRSLASGAQALAVLASQAHRRRGGGARAHVPARLASYQLSLHRLQREGLRHLLGSPFPSLPSFRPLALSRPAAYPHSSLSRSCVGRKSQRRGGPSEARSECSSHQARTLELTRERSRSRASAADEGRQERGKAEKGYYGYHVHRPSGLVPVTSNLQRRHVMWAASPLLCLLSTDDRSSQIPWYSSRRIQ